ncbi:unnamed protein product [Trifolium pratense]|uniref:Uncharacterized protein n=1 Tax=Trifolium pratense TaxID=57577 RepID=A0ACB0JC08_TRIPR|nr:unnamed protein product [Trifolium pratense]
MEKMVESEFPQVTPASGINLISGSQCSQVPNPGIDVDGRNKESAIEAAKLLSIQKEVGFSFEEDDDKTLKELMMQERSDRSKKMEWEQKEETKLEVITDSICYSIWGSQDCDWVYLPSVGRSGGILSIWSKSNNSLIFSFKGEGFVGVCLEWGVLKTICFVVNVYSKCDIVSKRRLWNNLLNCKRGLGDGRWCVVGDFNAIRRMEERIGVNTMVGGTMPTKVIEFQHFIDELELVDLPLFGRRFTWYHANGRAMSRIDRFLISDEWALRWGNGSVWVLDRDVSDHCPLLLKYSHDDWGPKPFRFNNFLLENKKFMEMVETFWVNYRVEGWMGFVLKEKLKALKSLIRDWHKQEYGGMEARIEELVEEIRDLDTRGELVGLSIQEVESRKEKFGALWNFLKNKETLMFQRSRSKWLKEGDGNTKFFHNSVKARLKLNLVSALRVGDEWALFLWEEELVVRLRDLLATVNLLMEDDGWKWVPDPEGVFSVKSTYLHLVDELRSGEVLEDGKAMIFDHIWDSPAPSKVIAFSWQLLHDRIPTRSNLAVRGILVADVPWECVGCVGSVESSIHLFLHCPSALKVWYDIFRWLGLVIVIPPSLFLLFEVLRASARNVKIRKGFLLIWHATIWSLWKARNGSIFANESFAPNDIVEEIKVTSWKWSLARLKVPPCAPRDKD